MTLSLFSLVGVVGALAIAPLVERRGIRVVAFLPLVGAPALIGIAMAGTSSTIFLASAALAGLLSSTLNAIGSAAGRYYPIGLRGQAIGWLSGAMRLSAMAGPWVAGLMLGVGLTRETTVALFALPPLLSVAAVMLVARHMSRQAQVD